MYALGQTLYRQYVGEYPLPYKNADELKVIYHPTVMAALNDKYSDNHSVENYTKMKTIVADLKRSGDKILRILGNMLEPDSALR